MHQIIVCLLFLLCAISVLGSQGVEGIWKKDASENWRFPKPYRNTHFYDVYEFSNKRWIGHRVYPQAAGSIFNYKFFYEAEDMIGIVIDGTHYFYKFEVNEETLVLCRGQSCGSFKRVEEAPTPTHGKTYRTPYIRFKIEWDHRGIKRTQILEGGNPYYSLPNSPVIKRARGRFSLTPPKELFDKKYSIVSVLGSIYLFDPDYRDSNSYLLHLIGIFLWNGEEDRVLHYDWTMRIGIGNSKEFSFSVDGEPGTMKITVLSRQILQGLFALL